MALEALASEAGRQAPYPFAVTADTLPEIDASPMWAALLDDLVHDLPAAVVAARFHAGIAAVFCRLAVECAASCGADAVALGGGCFQNQIMAASCEDMLRTSRLAVLVPAAVPANDGGLALGQAVVAAASALA